MTQIIIKKKQGKIFGFVATGHTGYAENGKDIVCSAISTILQSTCLGLKSVLNINISYDRKDKIGYLCVSLPKNISEDDLVKSQILFETMKLSLDDLAFGKEKYIKLEEEDVY